MLSTGMPACYTIASVNGMGMYLRKITNLWLILLPALLCTAQAVAAAPATAPTVVASLQPLYGLAAAVSRGVFEPVLLIPQNQSPHYYNLTPRAAHTLSRADLVLWIGPEMETRIAVPMQNLVETSRLLTVSTWPGIRRLPARSGGNWGQHSHGHEHAGHHEHEGLDPHLWLAPDNAVQIVERLRQELARLDPPHAEQYRSNADAVIAGIRVTERDIAQRFKTAQPGSYLILHDALQYFEQHYGLKPSGALMVDPERKPGAQRVLQLRQQLRGGDISCILYEARYGRRWIETLIEDTPVQAIAIDPMGLEVTADADHYSALIKKLADNLLRCSTS
jgi:zinc transport system substrate-binding protein